MGESSILSAVAVALAGAFALAGAVVMLLAANVAKKLAGFGVALLGALAALAVLQAPGALLAAAVAVGFGYISLGGGLVVRLQEGYHSVETPEINRADQGDEPAERRA